MDKYIVNIVTDLKIATNGQFFKRGYNPINETEAAYFVTTGNRVFKNGDMLAIRSAKLDERMALREKAFPSDKAVEVTPEPVVETEEVVVEEADEDNLEALQKEKIQALQKEYTEVLGKEPAARYKNDAKWLSDKIAEAK